MRVDGNRAYQKSVKHRVVVQSEPEKEINRRDRIKEKPSSSSAFSSYPVHPVHPV
jgi:hypothetical protein